MINCSWTQEHLRHAHREAFDDNMCIERLQYIFRNQTLVHSRVFVLLQLGQLVLPNVHHLDVAGLVVLCAAERACGVDGQRDGVVAMACGSRGDGLGRICEELRTRGNECRSCACSWSQIAGQGNRGREDEMHVCVIGDFARGKSSTSFLPSLHASPLPTPKTELRNYFNIFITALWYRQDFYP